MICRPCIELIAVCPDDFSGGNVTPPVPTRQRVCNTEQTASCPDGSQPQTIPAGTFCTIVFNPTAASLAVAQQQVDNMALAQAVSQVGDCAWGSLVWTESAVNVQLPHTGATISDSGSAGNFSVGASSPGNNPGGGSLGVLLLGKITFTYKPGVVTNHNLSGRFINSQTGAGSGVFSSQVTLKSGPNFGAMLTLFNESHVGAPGLGTFDFDFDFTSPGTSPLVYQLEITSTVYCESGVVHSQSITGLIKALD